MVLTRNIRLITMSVAFGVATLAPGSSWAVDTFLKISDCDGPVTAKGFEKQIHLSGFNSRVHNTLTTTGGGGGAGKAVIAPIEVLHDLDACSPQFFLDVINGKHIPQAIITFVRAKATGSPQAFYQITLSDVVITGVESMTVTQGQTTVQDPGAIELSEATDLAGVQEVVTLSFGRIELKDLISGHTAPFDLGLAR